MTRLLLLTFISIQIFNVATFNAADFAPKFFDINIDRDNPERVYKEFEEFVTKYKKEYKDEKEKRLRFDYFLENHNIVGKLNQNMKAAGVDTKFGVNKFSDMNENEFQTRYSHVAPKNNTKFPFYDPSKHKRRSKRQLDNMPVNFDLRNKKVGGRYIIGPVKDQGHCGCCWAFASTAIAEAALSVHLKKTMTLSDQEVCDCGASSTTPGCIGGTPEMGLEYSMEYGQTEEDEYPYVDGRSSQLGMCSSHNHDRVLQPFTLQPHRIDPFSAEHLIQKHLFQLNVPVAVAFRTGQSFRYVTEGVLQQEDCDLEKKDVWHSVAIVGWGTTRNSKGRSVDYWVLKNSWGEWGENDSGYFRVERGKNWCDVESRAVGGHIPE